MRKWEKRAGLGAGKWRREFQEGGGEEKMGRLEGIVCSQAEGAVCRAWRWALRTPGPSLLSGPEGKKTTHFRDRIRERSV